MRLARLAAVVTRGGAAMADRQERDIELDRGIYPEPGAPLWFTIERTKSIEVEIWRGRREPWEPSTT